MQATAANESRLKVTRESIETLERLVIISGLRANL